jgi:E3 SUMO-protein ligase PIAS1
VFFAMSVMCFYKLFSYSYFDQILKETSEDVDDVIVEADGQWHTTDNKYASAEWRLSHPLPPGSCPLSQKSPSSFNNLAKAPQDDEHRVKQGSEILILDSDDEDEGRVKRELSPSLASVARSTSGYLPTHSLPEETVIDLTADSEDESPPPTSQASSQKRKEPGAEMSLHSSSKRPRSEDTDVLRGMAMRQMAMRTVINNVSSISNQISTARDHVPHTSLQATPPLPPRYVGQQPRMSPRYDRTTPYPSYPTYPPTTRLSPTSRGSARPPGTSLQHRTWQ